MTVTNRTSVDIFVALATSVGRHSVDLSLSQLLSFLILIRSSNSYHILYCSKKNIR